MNILTFDIEEWHVGMKLHALNKKSYVHRLYKLLNKLLDDLDEYKLKGTFFCLGVIAREYPDIIKIIISRGHEIGCHSDKHNWLTNFTPDEFNCDTRIAIDSLEQVTGEKIKGYRAPAFSIGEHNKWILETLTMLGIEYDASIFPAKRDFGGFPLFEQQIPSVIHYNGTKIKEFPIGMTRLLWKEVAYSGGGYFRLFPYSMIKTWMSKSGYVMSYFHLHDFDREQEKVKEFSIRHFKSYYGINNAYDKFRRLISDFKFINLKKANEIINWDIMPIVELSNLPLRTENGLGGFVRGI